VHSASYARLAIANAALAIFTFALAILKSALGSFAFALAIFTSALASFMFALASADSALASFMFALGSFEFALASAEAAQAPYPGVCRFSASPMGRFPGPRGYRELVVRLQSFFGQQFDAFGTRRILSPALIRVCGPFADFQTFYESRTRVGPIPAVAR